MLFIFISPFFFASSIALSRLRNRQLSKTAQCTIPEIHTHIHNIYIYPRVCEIVINVVEKRGEGTRNSVVILTFTHPVNNDQ